MLINGSEISDNHFQNVHTKTSNKVRISLFNFNIFSIIKYHCRKEQEKIQAEKVKIEQLRIEESVERRPVSEACQELIQYILENQNKDYLLNPDKQLKNPWEKESKMPCLVL